MQNKKITILLAFVISFFFKFSQAQTTDAVLAYIARYKEVAISEMQRTGVPASITLAQGIHETEAGTSDLVRKSNNHFGIKCKSEWRGKSVSHDDDARGECFRKYTAPEDSYKDHSDFLKSSSRYAFLFNLDPMNFEAWAIGLKKAGYATNPKYSQILIKLILDYNLQDYTMIALGKMKPEEILVKNNNVTEEKQSGIKNTALVVTSKNYEVEETKADLIPAVSLNINFPSGEFKINETRVLFIKKGTSFLTIAQQYEIPLARIFEFNDMKEQEIAATDQLLFIQRKRKTGDHEFHVVQYGETIYSITQSEAIRVESLLEYNSLRMGMQPAVGETIYLRAKAPVMPKLAQPPPRILAVIVKDVNRQSIVRNEMNSDQNNYRDGKNNFMLHVVQPKETLYSIAKKYNVNFDDVVNWNQLQGSDLKIGQSLKIYQ